MPEPKGAKGFGPYFITINVGVVTYVFIILSSKISIAFGVDPNTPGREYPGELMLVVFGCAFVLFISLYAFSFKILLWIFKRLRI
ncbi:hypothetical protein C3B51_20660 [Pseudoalteromonas rubra]|uniref:DUF898 domain-containing protein n=1 Tax=Pseudoalteromonas rubra TaxID=43658 RepID=A0A4V2E1K9_9GAMM|nr:hypothetical protein C3B51_20660 [Pseudoalteromonas rubra]